LIILKRKKQSNLVLINPNFSFLLDFCFITNLNRRWLATSPRNSNIFVDDPAKLYRQRRHETRAKGLETLDQKSKRPSECPMESPPLSPKEDQPQPPPMGEQPQLECKIKL
jgi:hypothetical protein